MNLRMLTVGPFFTNCYVVWCDKHKEAIVIDPGFLRKDEAAKVLAIFKENELEVKFIVDTHGHPDHTFGNGVVKDATGASIIIHNLDSDMLGESGRRLQAYFGFNVASPIADSILKEGDVVEFGSFSLRVLHTPGHSPGSISLIGADCVFTGDTLFAGSIGRVDLPGGSGKEIVKSLQEKLAVLPDRFLIYPGHGPQSTIGKEKMYNPFLQPDFDTSLLE